MSSPQKRADIGKFGPERDASANSRFSSPRKRKHTSSSIGKKSLPSFISLEEKDQYKCMKCSAVLKATNLYNLGCHLEHVHVHPEIFNEHIATK